MPRRQACDETHGFLIATKEGTEGTERSKTKIREIYIYISNQNSIHIIYNSRGLVTP